MCADVFSRRSPLPKFTAFRDSTRQEIKKALHNKLGCFNQFRKDRVHKEEPCWQNENYFVRESKIFLYRVNYKVRQTNWKLRCWKIVRYFNSTNLFFIIVFLNFNLLILQIKFFAFRTIFYSNIGSFRQHIDLSLIFLLLISRLILHFNFDRYPEKENKKIPTFLLKLFISTKHDSVIILNFW